VNKIKVAAVFTVGSDRFDIVVLFYSLNKMSETGSCTVTGTKLTLYVPFCECMSPDGSSSTLAVDGFSEREYSYLIIKGLAYIIHLHLYYKSISQ